MEKLKKADTASAREELFEVYSDGIEPDPQEEFHRAIRKLNVTYTCAFEKDEGDAD